MFYFILLGGSWISLGGFAASGNRIGRRPGNRGRNIGFRIIRKHHAQP